MFYLMSWLLYIDVNVFYENIPLGRNLQGLATVSVRTISQADMKAHLPTIRKVLRQCVKMRVENFWYHKNGVKYELLKMEW